MKVVLIGSKAQKGISTLEVLIAFAVLILSITAVILVAFGNQAVALNTELTHRALIVARENLEQARNTATRDYDSLSTYYSTTTSTSTEGILKRELLVTHISECVKGVESKISWENGLSGERSVELFSLVDGPDEVIAYGGDCSPDVPGDWGNPDVVGSFDLDIEGISTTGNNGMDIDVEIRGNDVIAFVVSNSTATTTDPDFWVINVTDPENVFAEDWLDVGEGLNSLDVAGDYAYAVGNDPNSQLHIINVKEPNRLRHTATSSLSGVNPLGSFPSGISVSYYGDRLYVGTRETAGPEFHVFDVSHPLVPYEIGSLKLSHNVHDISIRGDYAYIASSDNFGELMAININEPESLEHPDDTGTRFDASGSQDGESVFVLGDIAYLGRTNAPSGGDFVTVDISDAKNMFALGGAESVDVLAHSLISDIIVRGTKAFLATSGRSKEFQVFDVSSSTAPMHTSVCASGYGLAQEATGIDYEGGFVYLTMMGSNSIRIIGDLDKECSKK